MNSSERVGPLSRVGGVFGIAFAIFFFVGLWITSPPDGHGQGHDLTAKAIAYYANSSNRFALIVSLYMVTLAGLCFLVFLSHLYRALARAEEGHGGLATAALVAGAVFVMVLVAATAVLGTGATAVSFGADPPFSVDVVLALQQVWATMLLIPGAFMAIALLGTTGIISLRTGVLPAWHAWFSFAVAVILLASVMFLPFMALPIWALVTGVVMLRGAPARSRSRSEQRSAREVTAA